MSLVALGAGEPLVISIEGIEEVQQELETLADELKNEASFGMMNDVGLAVAQWMRENVYMNFTKHPTGTLAASIFSTVMTNDQGASVYVGPNASQLPYTRIHEFGGDIYPVNKKWLSWVTDGKRYFSKHVYIPARPYIEPAFTEHEDQILEIMEAYLYEAIAADAAGL